MSTVKTNPRNFSMKIKGERKAMHLALHRAMQSAALRGLPHIRKRTPTDQGQAKASWEVERMMRRSGKRVISAQVVNDLVYAGVLEEGARPHPVSAEGFLSIWRWCQRNGVATDSEKDSVKFYGYIFTGADVRTAEMAFFITRKLATEGQKGHFMVAKSMRELRKIARTEAAEAVKRVGGSIVNRKA